MAAVRRAKQVCAQCLVREECLASALALNLDHGIWGGLSAQQRIKLRREGRRASSVAEYADAAAGATRGE